MSNIIKNIREDMLNERRKGEGSDKQILAFYAFTISELENIGKNTGNRTTTDDEAVAFIRKSVKATEDNLATLTSKDGVEATTIYLNKTLGILKGFLPQEISEDQIRQFFKEYAENNAVPHKGILIKAIKEKYGNTVDSKFAATIVGEYV